MKIFICFILVITFAVSMLAQHKDLPAITIKVVSQNEFVNRGHYSWNNRKVVFQLVNNSEKPVVIYGFKYDANFYPTGYMMHLNRKTNEWTYPNPENSPTKWKDVSAVKKSKLILKPNESIKFEADMGDVGVHYRRTVYASYKQNDKPREYSEKNLY